MEKLKFEIVLMSTNYQNGSLSLPLKSKSTELEGLRIHFLYISKGITGEMKWLQEKIFDACEIGE